jgi:hypothetical protein
MCEKLPAYWRKLLTEFYEIRLYLILGNMGTEVEPDFARWHYTDGRPEGVGCSSHGVCTSGGLWGLSEPRWRLCW